MKRMKCIKQHDEKDCGAACLLMISNYYGKKISMNKVRMAVGVDDNGCSMYGMIKGAESLGFNAEGLEGDFDELYDNYLENGKKPFVAHVLIDNLLEHYIVVCKMTQNKVTIADPSENNIITIEINDFCKIWTGEIVTFETTDEFYAVNNEEKKIKVWSNIFKYKKEVIKVIFSTVAISIISILSAYILEVVVDKKISKDVAGIISIKSIIIFAIGMCFVYIIKTILEVNRVRNILNMINGINRSIFTELYEKILKMPYKTYETYQTGDLMTRVEDVSIIGETLVEVIVSFSMNVTLLIIGAIVLLKKNSYFFLITLLFAILYMIVVYTLNPIIKSSNKRLLLNSSSFNSQIKESMDGMELVKINCLEEHMRDKAIDRYDCVLYENYNCSMVKTLESSLLSLFMLCFNVVLLCYGMYLVQINSITLGELLMIYIMSTFFQTPMLNMIELHPKIQSMYNELDRIKDILEYEEDNDDVELSDVNLQKTILFENVSFAYGMREEILKNLNLKICKGEKLAIIGKSGCGKTTIAKLLLRLYDNYNGKIKIGNVSLTNYPKSVVRNRIGYVSQKFEFFSGTIRYNLIFEKNICDDIIIDMLNKCHCNEILGKLPNGLDTFIDEKGSFFSVGEKQRLVIVRELLKNPDIIVLDEVTSNLDEFNTKMINNTITDMDPNVTCIIITHKQDVLKLCDKVYILDEGKYIN